VVYRRCPGGHSEPWCDDVAGTSSFQARHTIDVTVSASFAPHAVLRWLYTGILMLERVVEGQHHPTDYAAGFVVGRPAIEIARLLHNLN